MSPACGRGSVAAVCLLVITADDAIARWSSQPIELGGGNRFTAFVLGPSGVPEVV